MSDLLTAHDGPALAEALRRLQARHPLKIDLGLERIDRVCAALGRPERRLPPVVHIAGTNGKGSTAAFLRATAEAAGLRVHTLTSPHLVRFVERLRLGGVFADEAAWVAALAQVEAAGGGAALSFFEAVTAAQFLLMAQTPADLAIVEVGLGGRYDATNLVDPALAVITPVALDHREYLGDTLAQIAGEKAGIVKRDRPALVARQDPEAMAVIVRAATAARARLTAFGEADPDGEATDAWIEGGRLQVAWSGRHFDLPAPALAGAHQVQNAGLAVVAALMLGLDEAALAPGVAGARWPARLQRLTAGPLASAAAARGSDLWLDGGHNPHAAGVVADFARDLHARDGRPVALIVGLLANKDAAGVFAALAGAASPIVTTGFRASAAARPAALVRAAASVGVEVEGAPDVKLALDRVLTEPGPAPHVIVCGSLYLAGEVLGLDPATWPQ